MIPDGEYTAVVVKIEQTLVTLELSDGEEKEEGELYKLVVGEEELPKKACHADAILNVTLVNEEVVEAAYDPDETTEQKEEAQSRFDRLSKRPPSDQE